VPSRKIRLALIFGGQSAEHDVSLISARSVLQAIDPARYEVLPIAISPGGEWLAGASAMQLLGAPAGQTSETGEHLQIEDSPATVSQAVRALSPTGPRHESSTIDVVFPVLHGPHGEDGTVQGLLELAGVPYVGAGVAASAVGMDKILMKRLFLEAGLPVVPFVAVTRASWRANPDAATDEIEARIGYPCFVKPANMGSSVGISKVESAAGLAAAMDEAARYDRRLLVEKAAPAAREIECGVLGNDEPEVSVVGEIMVAASAPFYDYAAKYEPGASELVVPAAIPAEISDRVRDLARRAFLAIDGAGMARVDFFLCGDEVFLNEINTIPGFTPMSMFPRLWEASGVSYARQIDRLVDLALERHSR
jgi:D-alanine-D-alanine ligase